MAIFWKINKTVKIQISKLVQIVLLGEIAIVCSNFIIHFASKHNRPRQVFPRTPVPSPERQPAAVAATSRPWTKKRISQPNWNDWQEILQLAVTQHNLLSNNQL